MKFWTKSIPPEQVWTVPEGVSIRVFKEGEPHDLLPGEKLEGISPFQKLASILCGETHPHLYCLTRGPEHDPLVFVSKAPLDIPGAQEVASLPTPGAPAKRFPSLRVKFDQRVLELIQTEGGWDKIVASLKNPLRNRLVYTSLARQCLEIKTGLPLWFKGKPLTPRGIRIYPEHSASLNIEETLANPKRTLDKLFDDMLLAIAGDEEKAFLSVLQQTSRRTVVEDPAARSLPGCLQKAFAQFFDQGHTPRHLILPRGLGGRFDQETGISKKAAKFPYQGSPMVYGCQMHVTRETPFLWVLGDDHEVGEFNEGPSTWDTSSYFPTEHQFFFEGASYMKLKENPAIMKIVPAWSATTD